MQCHYFPVVAWFTREPEADTGPSLLLKSALDSDRRFPDPPESKKLV